MKKRRRKLTKEEIEKEIKKVEKIAKMISKKWPKGMSAVEAIREERR